MEKIYCDICKNEFDSVYRGVRLDDPTAIRVGSQHYADVCTKCLKEVSEFVETLKKK